jgi:hypothetical protein
MGEDDEWEQGGGAYALTTAQDAIATGTAALERAYAAQRNVEQAERELAMKRTPTDRRLAEINLARAKERAQKAANEATILAERAKNLSVTVRQNTERINAYSRAKYLKYKHKYLQHKNM